MPIVMSRRALGRATLARQLLLDRSDAGVLATVTTLIGLQAQIPATPYLALWSRLRDFDPAVLSSAIQRRELVRTVVMRSTIHLVTAQDALGLRPLMQQVMDREIARHGVYSKPLVGVDVAPVLRFAADLLTREQLTTTQLRAAIDEAFPGAPTEALAYACRCLLPLVQVPPRGLWRRSGAVRLAYAPAWLGRPVEVDPSTDDLVLRYLAAFGPATVADLAAWSRLTGMRDWVDRVRDRLVTVIDETGRELFDLPDAPRPPDDVPAPVRVLPEYDNVLLSHADRSRFHRPDAARLPIDAPVHGTALSDGLVSALWTQVRPPGRLHVTVNLLTKLPRTQLEAIEAEATRALEFTDPEAKRTLEMVVAP